MIKPNTLQSEPISQRMEFPGTDLTILVTLENGALTMLVGKAGKSLYRAVIEQATLPLPNAWLTDMFMREDRVRLSELCADVEEYVDSLNISQG